MLLAGVVQTAIPVTEADDTVRALDAECPLTGRVGAVAGARPARGVTHCATLAVAARRALREAPAAAGIAGKFAAVLRLAGGAFARAIASRFGDRRVVVARRGGAHRGPVRERTAVTLGAVALAGARRCPRARGAIAAGVTVYGHTSALMVGLGAALADSVALGVAADAIDAGEPGDTVTVI